ncbi:MAG: hypothetical protein IT438_05415 [Phycisphaerales bacterium]|nr:hypothetical protein [Phycisphaerales bacterium]
MLWWLAPLVAAIVVTALTIGESQRHGRLSTFAVVDNVNYMGEGAVWVRAFRTDGAAGILERYLEHPPHAPFIVATVFAAFIIGGMDEACAHAAGAVPLLGAFGFVWWLSRRVAWPMRLVTLALCATTPIWMWSIEIVKPDYMAAIAAMIAAMLLVLDARRKPWWWLVANGMIWGFALWAKPTIFPATLWLCGIAVLLRAWRVRCERGGSLVGHAVRMGLLVGAGVQVVSGPHYAIAGGEIVRYITRNMFGDKSGAWRWHGTVVEHAAFHLLGGGGRAMLGPARVWMVTCCAAGFVVAARARAAARRSAVALAALLAAAYVPAAVNPMKIREFAAAFQVGLVFCSTIAIVYIWRVGCVCGRDRRRSAMVLGLAAMLAFAAATLAWPFPRMMTADSRLEADARAETIDATYRAVVRAIDASRSPDGSDAWIVVGGGAGAVNRGLLNLWMTRDRVPARAGSITSRRDRDKTLNLLGPADIAVAGVGPIAGSKGGKRTGWSEEFIAHARSAQEEWDEYARVEGEDGSYFVFVRARDRGGTKRIDHDEDEEAAEY